MSEHRLARTGEALRIEIAALEEQCARLEGDPASRAILLKKRAKIAELRRTLPAPWSWEAVQARRAAGIRVAPAAREEA